MQHIFITSAGLESPRWQVAFPEAVIYEESLDAPEDLQNSFVWVLSSHTGLGSVGAWVAAGAKVIVLTRNEDAAEARQALEAGASGYLHYLAAAPVLEQVVQVVRLGGLWLGVDLMRQLVSATAAILSHVAPVQQTSSPRLELLTQRERAVADAVAAGKTNKEVARELDITERTVKAHLGAAFEKLQVRDRLQLVLVMSGRQ